MTHFYAFVVIGGMRTKAFDAKRTLVFRTSLAKESNSCSGMTTVFFDQIANEWLYKWSILCWGVRELKWDCIKLVPFDWLGTGRFGALHWNIIQQNNLPYSAKSVATLPPVNSYTLMLVHENWQEWDQMYFLTSVLNPIGSESLDRVRETPSAAVEALPLPAKRPSPVQIPDLCQLWPEEPRLNIKLLSDVDNNINTQYKNPIVGFSVSGAQWTFS